MWITHLRETWCCCSSDLHHHYCEQLHHPAVAWQKWDTKGSSTASSVQTYFNMKSNSGQAFSLRKSVFCCMNVAYWGCGCVLSNTFTYLNIGISPRRNICLKILLMNILWSRTLLLFDLQVAETFENLQKTHQNVSSPFFLFKHSSGFCLFCCCFFFCLVYIELQKHVEICVW